MDAVKVVLMVELSTGHTTKCEVMLKGEKLEITADNGNKELKDGDIVTVTFPVNIY